MSGLSEVKTPIFSLVSAVPSEFVVRLFERYGNLKRLQRIVAYIFRFKKRTLKQTTFETSSLSVNEMDYALTVLIRLSQMQCFASEINALNKGQNLSNNSKLLSLNPFLDKDHILRVGGGLSNSDIEFKQKHPIILPEKHKLTYLIVRQEHCKHYTQALKICYHL